MSAFFRRFRGSASHPTIGSPQRPRRRRRRARLEARAATGAVLAALVVLAVTLARPAHAYFCQADAGVSAEGLALDGATVAACGDQPVEAQEPPPYQGCVDKRLGEGLGARQCYTRCWTSCHPTFEPEIPGCQEAMCKACGGAYNALPGVCDDKPKSDGAGIGIDLPAEGEALDAGATAPMDGFPAD